MTKKQFEQSLDALREKGLSPLRERSMRRLFAQAELMQLIHAPKGNSDPNTVAELVDEARERLKKPKHKRAPIEPMRPKTWQSAFLVTKQACRIVKEEPKRSRLRNHNTAQKTTPKYYKFCGHRLINLINRSAEQCDKLQMDLAYTNGRA